MEFIITHLVSVVLTAIIIFGVVTFLDSIRRKFNKGQRYHITYEYKLFIYSISNCNEAIDKLNILGKEGWEVCYLAGQNVFATSLILKRETLHTTKANGK